MDIARAFDKTLKDLNLSAREVAEKAGLREGVISKFRNYRQTVQTDTLDKLLGALDDEAKIYFCSLLVEKDIDLEMIVSRMDVATISKLLLIIADRISPQENKQAKDKNQESEDIKIESNDKNRESDERENKKQVVRSGAKREN